METTVFVSRRLDIPQRSTSELNIHISVSPSPDICFYFCTVSIFATDWRLVFPIRSPTFFNCDFNGEVSITAFLPEAGWCHRWWHSELFLVHKQSLWQLLCPFGWLLLLPYLQSGGEWEPQMVSREVATSPGSPWWFRRALPSSPPFSVGCGSQAHILDWELHWGFSKGRINPLTSRSVSEGVG